MTEQSVLYAYSYGGPPPTIFSCIEFNSIRTSKEKQKVILQVDVNFSFKIYPACHIVAHRIKPVSN